MLQSIKQLSICLSALFILSSCGSTEAVVVSSSVTHSDDVSLNSNADEMDANSYIKLLCASEWDCTSPDSTWVFRQNGSFELDVADSQSNDSEEDDDSEESDEDSTASAATLSDSAGSWYLIDTNGVISIHVNPQGDSLGEEYSITYNASGSLLLENSTGVKYELIPVNSDSAAG